jgi:hypothetical protein
MFRAKVASIALIVTLLVAAPATASQDAATAESVAAGECVAPELPPGEVTPPDEAAATDVDDAGDAAAAPTPPPEGITADQATIDRFIAAEENLNACLNIGDFEGAAAVFSPAGLEFFFGSANPYDAAANLAGYPALTTVRIQNVETLADGRVRGEIIYMVGKQLTGSVDYWVDQDGLLLLDAFADLPQRLEAPAGAPVVELAMIDYAFVLDEYTVPAAETIAFRTSIDSATDSDHVATLLGCQEGTTVEQLITGEVDYTTACPDSYGQMYLRPGQGEHDMILMGLEPGTYFFICDVVTPAGHSHQELGMVAQVIIT